ncbi:MAG: hypothetical protein QOE90_1993 [Thermoplasmata archaeon]|jgi:hypothetical protein|nr:hypothetical protein [Thermoplasmata archaeon]
MESVVWTVDWNPEFADEARLKREILRALNDGKTIATIRRFAEQAAREASEDSMETEHIVWLDSSYEHAFFVRVWYELSESKLFIVVEENDLGDMGFLLFENMACASYAQDSDDVLKVELADPDDLGVPP